MKLSPILITITSGVTGNKRYLPESIAKCYFSEVRILHCLWTLSNKMVFVNQMKIFFGVLGAAGTVNVCVRFFALPYMPVRTNQKCEDACQMLTTSWIFQLFILASRCGYDQRVHHSFCRCSCPDFPQGAHPSNQPSQHFHGSHRPRSNRRSALQ